MIGLGLVGAGRMGLSHLAIAGAHPSIEIVAVCESAGPVLSALRSYKSYPCLKSYERLLELDGLNAVLVATPTSSHEPMVRAALDKGLHVFVEKPFCLDPDDGADLADLAEAKGLVNQVGYHNRFVATFREAKRLLEIGVLGEIHHIQGEAYGQVVTRPQTGTWRFKNAKEGGCLLDYASHVIDLMNFFLGPPRGVSGTVLQSIYSKAVDDAVYATFVYEGGCTGQISVNWSDRTYRKMSTRVTLSGRGGKLVADRQELRVYLAEARPDLGFEQGWNLRNITELTEPVWYYLRGEEYSAQIDYFVSAIEQERQDNVSSFRHALECDRVMNKLRRNAEGLDTDSSEGPAEKPRPAREHGRRFRLFSSR